MVGISRMLCENDSHGVLAMHRWKFGFPANTTPPISLPFSSLQARGSPQKNMIIVEFQHFYRAPTWTTLNMCSSVVVFRSSTRDLHGQCSYDITVEKNGHEKGDVDEEIVNFEIHLRMSALSGGSGFRVRVGHSLVVITIVAIIPHICQFFDTGSISAQNLTPKDP